MGKPTPKAEVMRFLKSRQYTDAKDFAGECEPVVMIAKGQSVQGTCKYGTRVDYSFVPRSYSVLSSKGTSDHHIVKVDVVKKSGREGQENGGSRRRAKPPKQQRVVKISSNNVATKGIWADSSNTYQADRQR
uniref:Uncharacterized protein n=1 Tax=Kalanchoe fedtschenkoi TaxID=63787 RepID=A0A7N0SYG9_KALFE